MQLVYRQPFRVSRSAAHPALEEILDVFLVRFIIQEQIVTSGLRLARFSPVVERMRSLHIVADRAFAVFVKVMRFRAVFVFGAAFQQRAAGRTLRPINDMIAVRVLRSIVGEDISSRNVIPHFTFTMMLAPHILRVVAIGVHAGSDASSPPPSAAQLPHRSAFPGRVQGRRVCPRRSGTDWGGNAPPHLPARALRRAPNAAQHQDAERSASIFFISLIAFTFPFSDLFRVLDGQICNAIIAHGEWLAVRFVFVNKQHTFCVAEDCSVTLPRALGNGTQKKTRNGSVPLRVADLKPWSVFARLPVRAANGVDDGVEPVAVEELDQPLSQAAASLG